jgi:hypothetical protein
MQKTVHCCNDIIFLPFKEKNNMHAFLFGPLVKMTKILLKLKKELKLLIDGV